MDSIPPRPVVLPRELTDADRRWCREQLADTGRTLWDDFRSPAGVYSGVTAHWITTEAIR